MYKPSEKTLALLSDLEDRIDPEVEDDYQKQWEDFLDGKFNGEIFMPLRKKIAAPKTVWPKININDALESYDVMLQSELCRASWALNSNGRVPCIRANYGTGIMTSLFGAEIFVMPRENNTLPTTRPFDDTDKIRQTLEKGIPEHTAGFGKKVFEFGEICAELFEKYPKIKKYVPVNHPDFQGPLDACELLWGCEMFYAMYDEPELVHGMLSLITDTYTEMMKKWYAIIPPEKDLNPHWQSFYYRGNILLRSDSAMNVSPDTYNEFSLTYDKKLLDAFGGGAVHFCGRGDHYIEALCSLPNVTGINMSQPQYNDMEKIYKATVDKKIPLLGFNYDRAHSDVIRNGAFNGFLHTVTK